MGVGPASVCISVCVCVCLFIYSNMDISATSGPIATKFYLKHLVSMAADSSHRFIKGKIVWPF